MLSISKFRMKRLCMCLNPQKFQRICPTISSTLSMLPADNCYDNLQPIINWSIEIFMNMLD